MVRSWVESKGPHKYQHHSELFLNVTLLSVWGRVERLLSG